MKPKFSADEFYLGSFDAGWDCGLLKQHVDRATDLDWWATYCMGGEL